LSPARQTQFEKNLKTLIESRHFKNTNVKLQINLLHRFLESPYGKGTFFGLGKIKQLKLSGIKNIEEIL